MHNSCIFISSEGSSLWNIIRELNRLGGKRGIGIVDIVENRVVLDRETTEMKIILANKFITLFGFSTKVRAMKMQNLNK